MGDKVMGLQCEQCGKQHSGDMWDTWEFCTYCSNDLCPDCFKSHACPQKGEWLRLIEESKKRQAEEGNEWPEYTGDGR